MTTPSSSSTSTPTPSPRIPAYKKSELYKTINHFLQTIIRNKHYHISAMIFLSIIGIISSSLLPSYCISDTRLLSCNYCTQCPSHSKCTYLSFECDTNYTNFYNGCIHNDLLTDDKVHLADAIIRAMKSNKIKTLNELCQKTEESPLRIRNILEFTNYRLDPNDHIYKVNSHPSRFLFAILLFVCLISQSLLVFLIYLRCKNQ